MLKIRLQISVIITLIQIDYTFCFLSTSLICAYTVNKALNKTESVQLDTSAILVVEGREMVSEQHETQTIRCVMATLGKNQALAKKTLNKVFSCVFRSKNAANKTEQ